MDAVRELSYGKVIGEIQSLSPAIRAIDPMYNGCIYDGTTLRIPVLSADTSKDGQVDALITDWNDCAVSADKTTITADLVDSAVITCDVSPEVAATYTVWFNHEIQLTGDATMTGNVAEVTLLVDTAGEYQVEINAGSLSGFITIEAVK